MGLYGQETIKVSYHPAKFGVHRHSGSGDIIFLVCQVTSQGQVMVSHYPAKFITHKHCGIIIIIIIIIIILVFFLFQYYFIILVLSYLSVFGFLAHNSLRILKSYGIVSLTLKASPNIVGDIVGHEVIYKFQ